MFKNDCIDKFETKATDLHKESVVKMRQMSDEEWPETYKEYTFLHAIQSSIYTDERLTTFLLQVFAKLPKLDSISIPASMDFTDTEGDLVQYSSLMGKAVRRTLLGPMTSTSGNSVTDIWCVLAAAAGAKVQLKHAWIDYQPDICIDSIFLFTPELQWTFHKLHSLKLKFAPLGDKPAIPYIIMFHRIMAQCQQLRHLYAEAKEPLAITITAIGLYLPWTHLQSLTLANIELLENQLADFLIGHQPSLCWFEARACPLKSGSWASLSQRLQPYLAASIKGSDKRASFASKDRPPHPTPIRSPRMYDEWELGKGLDDTTGSEDRDRDA